MRERELAHQPPQVTMRNGRAGGWSQAASSTGSLATGGSVAVRRRVGNGWSGDRSAGGSVGSSAADGVSKPADGLSSYANRQAVGRQLVPATVGGQWAVVGRWSVGQLGGWLGGQLCLLPVATAVDSAAGGWWRMVGSWW